jgi:hypothetical protein
VTEPQPVSEGRELLDAYFDLSNQNAEDRERRAIDFREAVLRLVIFDLHLAIEDLLKWDLHRRLRAVSALDESSDTRYIKEMPAGEAIDLSARLGIIDAELHGALRQLNAVRNRAGHTWAPGEPQLTHGLAERTSKHPLHWREKSLTPAVMRDEFCRFTTTSIRECSRATSTRRRESTGATARTSDRVIGDAPWREAGRRRPGAGRDGSLVDFA